MDKKYYSTGEFARLCGVNKKTLFHYDEINLLKPEKVLDNGYRYYSYKQLELFSVISILKDLEMPLKEIIKFIDSRNPAKTEEVFSEKKKLIEEKINNFKRMQKLLEVKLDIINESKHCYSNDISIEKQDEDFIVLSNFIKDTEESYDVNTFVEHVKYCNNNKLSYGYPIGSIINKEHLLKKEFLTYDYYFTKLPHSKIFNKYSKKDQGLYVVGYHFGYYDSLPATYERLLNYIDENNLIIDGNAYEEILIDEIISKNPNDYIFKISIKIKE